MQYIYHTLVKCGHSLLKKGKANLTTRLFHNQSKLKDLIKFNQVYFKSYFRRYFLIP